ncbi:MAG TPA: tryptophan 2,3-dioxygenase family protein [Ktedonobacterales bacterium]|nr:tryptophan 2,3-dioxygenase family protein [Ktedonobacterales bacterium]
MSAQTPPTHAPRPAKRESTVYERYLRTDELLALQKPAEERLHPDELTFQVVHQTFELWWKQTVQQMRAAADALAGDEAPEAARALRRAVEAQAVVTAALRQLEFVSPATFLVIRRGLEDGSGGDSPGFRAILRAAPDLWDAFAAAVERAGTTLVGLYADPHAHPALYDCAEALTDFDEAFHLFRAMHLKLAQRNLGLQATGTGGTPMAALERTLGDLLFPDLWQARDQLLEKVQRESGITYPVIPRSGHGGS